MLYELEQSRWQLEKQPPKSFSSAILLLFYEDQVVSESRDTFVPIQVSNTDIRLAPSLSLYLGQVDGIPWFAAQVASMSAEESELLFTIRDAAPYSELAFAMISRAKQLFQWQKDHQFCGRCGQATEIAGHEHAARCKSCDLTQYPRVSPCIIVLVTRGDEVLLAQNIRAKKTGMYSTLAGFIEAGESAEQALYREVLEETGIQVKNAVYRNSQTWPFPHQLMLGFTAEYDSGEIVLQDDELLDAGWWSLDDLPKHPPAFTIAGWLIREYKKTRQ